MKHNTFTVFFWKPYQCKATVEVGCGSQAFVLHSPRTWIVCSKRRPGVAGNGGDHGSFQVVENLHHLNQNYSRLRSIISKRLRCLIPFPWSSPPSPVGCHRLSPSPQRWDLVITALGDDSLGPQGYRGHDALPWEDCPILRRGQADERHSSWWMLVTCGYQWVFLVLSVHKERHGRYVVTPERTQVKVCAILYV